MPSEYFCNLIIPGAAKSGTSLLHKLLNAHPMIMMSSQKEPHHFCRDALYSKGAAVHNLLFNQKSQAQFFGESSTGYLPWSKAAERIARDLDNPKAIIILRHPVARCFSHYRWRYRLGLENRKFLEALECDGFGFNPELPTEFGYMAYLEFSQYAQHCPVWEKAMGSENCLFLAFDELKRDYPATLTQCFNFLRLPQVEVALPEDMNETDKLGRRPSSAMTRLAKILPSTAKTSSFYQRMKKGLLRATAPEPPKEMTMEERNFVEESLANDITWYEERFAKRKSTIGR